MANGAREVVVRDISMDIADKEIVCILGPSGCGKSTLIDMILQEYGYTDIVLRKDLRGVVRAARGKKK